jgi:tellurite resistance protein TerC
MEGRNPVGSETIWLWVGFNLFVLAMLALDLGVLHRHAHAVSLKEAAAWSILWIALALTFDLGVYFWRGPETALEFLAGYLIEKSLSVDNIFVFVLLFAALGVPATSQHRVLFWGVLGALVMRGILILVGSVLLHEFHWIIYLFGAFLILTGVRMARHDPAEQHPENNPLLRFLRRFLPLTHTYDHDRFFVRQAGRRLATPLLLVLVAIESADLLFAVDSIPAVLAVTSDPFIVYTSNVFAILGLRALYFVFATVVSQFYYLRHGLSVILTFVGAKMLLADIYKIPIGVSLLVIAGILAAAMAASFWRAWRLAREGRGALGE